MFSEQPQQHHAMELVGKDESGAEEWYCPTCGRRFLMQWPPEYKKVILEAGDEYAIHSGGKNRASLGTPQGALHQENEFLPEPEIQDDEVNLVEDETLLPWLEWMERVNFELLWNREI